MAKKDAKTAGSTFLAEVLAKLPTELQAQAKAAFEAAEASAAIEVLGEGVLRQADYGRAMTEVQAKETELETWHGQLNEWFGGVKEELVAARTKKPGTEPIDPVTKQPVTSTIDPTKVVTKEQLEQVLGDTERGAVQFFSNLNALSLQHFKDFGEVLDTNALLTDKRLLKGELKLDDVYKDAHKEKLTAKAQKAEADQREAIRLEERTKLQKEMATTHHPYPVSGREGPSTLDAIEAARTGQAPVAKSVDDMAAEYSRLAAGQRSTTSV